MPRRSVWIELAHFALVLLFMTLRFAPATGLFWTYDDAWLLRLAEEQPIRNYFTAPQFWQALPHQMFVPFIHTWFDVVSSTAGANPAMFYALAIVWLNLALAASYLALRQWLGPVSSLAAIAMIGFGPPVVSVVTQLMSTHYLFALTFSSLAIAFWTAGVSPAGAAASRAAASGGRRDAALPAAETAAVQKAILSAFFYFFAILAKEIAVPLPLLLLLLPHTRPKHLAPHAIALALYLAWRKWMIGAFLGGYGWVVTRDTAGSLLRSLPRQIAASIGPPQLWIVVLLALVLLLPIVWRMRSRKFAIAAVIAIGAALGPVIPVSREMQPRFVFALWITLVVLFAIAIREKPLLAALGVVIVGIAHAAEWRDVVPLAERMSAEARFVMNAPPNATLRLPKVPPAAMGELLAMRTATPGTQAFYDDLYLCRGAHRGRRVFQYAPDRVRDITSDIEAIVRQQCGAVRGNVPLRARFRFDDGTLYWQFGPYEQGTWTIVFGDGAQAFPVPRGDTFKLGNAPGLALRIRYDSPEGWRTYSETIHLDFAKR